MGLFIFTAFDGEYMLAFRRIVTRRDRFLVNFRQHAKACVWSKLLTSDSISSNKFWEKNQNKMKSQNQLKSPSSYREQIWHL